MEGKPGTASRVPLNSQGFQLGSITTHGWTWIIPFPLPREDQQRAKGWILLGRAELSKRAQSRLGLLGLQYKSNTTS